MEEKWKKIFSKEHKLMYMGFTIDGRPFGTGVSYYENGNKCQEGVFDEKGLVYGKEYYQHGILRFEGVYTRNKGYGPNYPSYGSCYDEDGNKIFYGELRVKKRGSMGFPMIVRPEEYGFITPKGMPDFRTKKWGEEDAGPHGIFYVNTKGRERKELVEFLERNGFKCEKDEVTTRESTLSSKYPLKVSFDDRSYGHIHTITSSAAAEASKRTLPAEIFKDIFEGSFAFVIV